MKIPMNAVVSVVETVLRGYARRATKYLDDHTIVRATCIRWGLPKPGKRIGRCREYSNRSELVLTVGRPNYRERKFIKLCKDAGEPFPVKKVQLR
jgi:hypothetical protein